jgi:hypothetical protein
VIDAADQDRMAPAYTGLRAVNDGALWVQVSCPALYTETENVARSPQVLPDLLAVSEHRTEDADLLTPEDLLVVGDAHRFYLWSRPRARPIEPEVFSAVEFTNFAHPLLRFVREISTARTAACGPFSWGVAGQLPFLPRLRYHRAVLSHARWTVASAGLPDRTASWPEWTTGTPPCTKPPPTTRSADSTGAHEIVVAFASTHARTWPPIPPSAAPVAVTTAQHGHLPGAGVWLFRKLYGHPDRHTAMLDGHLPDLLSAWDKPVQWWFLPYRDPDNHLRLRLPDATEFGQATPAQAPTLGKAARCGPPADWDRRIEPGQRSGCCRNGTLAPA